MNDEKMDQRAWSLVEIDESVGKALADVALLLYGDGAVAVIPKPGAGVAGAPGSEAASAIGDSPHVTARSLPRGWVSIRDAAATLGFSVVSLRRLIERNARRAADGGTEAVVDGVRARKVGRTWRVQLSDAWTSGRPTGPRRRVLHDVRGSARR
ncbi:MAG: hypothetical protein K8H88_19930, partial [Sandaracinaceae bacterium]|nr:hypothetical protein [Sandaracinaceae bacterium]